jgi:pyrroline-5-carboxylate reductase
MTAKKSIGFVGAGNMAEAMIRGLLRGKVFAPGQVTASAPREERQRELSEKYAIHVTRENREAATQSIVVLSVKPQILGKVLDEISDSVRAETLVISIAAGVPVAANGNARGASDAEHAGARRCGRDRDRARRACAGIRPRRCQENLRCGRPDGRSR